MRFLHTSDLHLCSDFSASCLPPPVTSAHRRQLWQSFYTIISACQQEHVDILLISGDLIEMQYARIADVKRCADAFVMIPETKVFISCGNHDPLTSSSYYKFVDFPPNVTFFPNAFARADIPQLNTCVYGYSWDKNRYESMPFDIPAAEPDKINLLSLHCDVMTKSPYMPVSSDAFAGKNFDYVALGHIHKRAQVREQIFYCGSPEPLNFGEEGKHGYIVGEHDGKNISVKFKSSAVREFITRTLEVNGSMGYHEIKEAVFKACDINPAQNIYRIRFTGILSPQVDLDLVIEDMGEAFYHIEYVNDCSVDMDIDKLYFDNRGNIIGRYIEQFRSLPADDKIAAKALMLGLNALIQEKSETQK